MKLNGRKTVVTVWILLVLAAIGILWSRGPLPQDQAYHAFADHRPLWGIPNFGDVMSNLPFAFIGAYGMWLIMWLHRRRTTNSAKLLGNADFASLTIFCVGVILTCFGSAYYHWSPSNATLAWDRFPMTIAFAGLVAMVVSDRISSRLAAWLLIPLLCAGAASVFYWHYTEQQGRGDLRPYAIVQFAPLCMLPVMALGFKARYLKAGVLMHALFWYALAKVLETADHQVFKAWTLLGIEVVSGHSLKHVAASVAPLVILNGIRKQALLEEPTRSY